MMFRFPSVICTRCTGFFCLAIIKGPPNDIYCIIEEPSKHYFTEKVSYSQECFGNPKALRVFISTDVSLSTQEILDSYAKRWSIELFFRQSKQKLGLDKYQIRSSQGIQRYWLIMSLTHYLCCMFKGKYCTFEEGYFYTIKLKKERITAIYRLIQHGASLKDVLMIAG